MDAGRKRAGLAVICGTLIVILATGAAFTANTNADQPQATGNGNVVASEEASERYATYNQYGLTYDKATDHLYYNGTLVRYFKDNSILYNGDGTIDGSVIEHTSTDGKGEVDVYAVRDSKGKLIGVRIADQDEYNNITTMGQSIDQATRKYSEFGLKVSVTGKMYFDGYLVRELYDSASGELITESIGAAFPKDSIDVIAVYSNERLTGLRKATQQEYDARTQERMEFVQDYWVERQNQKR